MISAREIRESILGLIFPQVCPGCGNELHGVHSELCLSCINAMPETNFEMLSPNLVEKKFWGRLPLEAAAASFYFTGASLMQRLMHEFKYRSNRELGSQLGRMMGERIVQSGRFPADVLVPLPLFPSKEHKRGFNQALDLCEGIAEVMRIPVLNGAVIRPHFTETQTRKGRIERWKNMEGKFLVRRPGEFEGRHILLVDDVVTTGATLESCGNEILAAGGSTRLSIATLCFAVNK